uniref:Uncharacterized protein n=1 Tax=Hemiselmis andersenii TaxID=464988 RepID=A0A7S0TSL3_HEMAN
MDGSQRRVLALLSALALTALVGTSLVRVGVKGQLAPTFLFGGGPDHFGAPYMPESFPGSFTHPYTPSRPLGMVQYMPLNETAWWTSESSGAAASNSTATTNSTAATEAAATRAQGTTVLAQRIHRMHLLHRAFAASKGRAVGS